MSVRVCMATDSHAPSGMGAHMLSLAEALDDADVTIVARPDTALFAKAARRFAVKRLDGSGAELGDWLRRSGFDLVHVHAGIGWEGHDLALAAHDAGIPVVRTEHLPQLLTEEADIARYRTATGGVAATLAVSEAVAQSYRSAALVTSPLAVVANGIAPAAPTADSLARFERTSTRPVLLNVGRLSPQKNQALLLETVAELARRGRPVDAMVVGEGPDQAELLAHARALGVLGAVRFMGARSDVPALMQMADLFVQCSQFEGLPLAVLEAMAAGLPIVACSAPGVDETIGPDTAFMAPGATASDLADTIEAALTDDAARAQRVTAARERQATQFSADRMAHETRAHYAQHARTPANLDQTRIGFIGAGGIARRHLDILRQMDDVAVAAVTDADFERAVGMAGDMGARAFASVDDMIAEAALDAVFICVPPSAHGAIERAVIAAGLPLFVEKPVALDLALAEELAAAIEARGLVSAVGYHWRWLDSLGPVRDVLQGRPARLLSGYWLDSTPPPQWWWHQDESGGQMLEQATHLIDLALYLCGNATSVFGMAEHTQRAAYPTLDVATASTAAVRFADGAVANFAATCLLGWNHRVGLHLFGEGFAIELTDHDVMIDVGHGRPVTPNHSDPVWHQDRAFIDAVRGGDNRIRATYRDGVDTLRVVDAVNRSARSGSVVQLGSGALEELAA